MNLTGTQAKSTVIHLATSHSYTWKGEACTMHIRTCGINANSTIAALVNVAERDAAEVTCRSCRKLATQA